MERIRHFINKNKKAVIVTAFLIVLLIAGLVIYFFARQNNVNADVPKQEEQQEATWEKPQKIDQEALKPLEEKGVIAGIKDLKVEKGTEIDLKELIYVDSDVVESVAVDERDVDYSKEGTYKVVYTVIFDGDKLNDYLKDNDMTVDFNTDGETVTVEVTGKVTVVDEETVKEEKDGGDIITSENKEKVAKVNQEQVDKNSGGNSLSAAISTDSDDKKPGEGNGSQTSHTHKWVDHQATKQVWVPNIVTVDDYETQTIRGARFYTYGGVDANGNDTYIANGPTYWIENGFTDADLQAIIVEGLRNADEHGLYNGVYYGNYQNVTKTENVKVGSHEEDQGYYENQTYVDYQYCSECGAKKQ